MSVIVFGGGIAGLSTSHFLMERGYKVTVIESLNIPGGLSRSERINGKPMEYSWRGFGPWYHNTFDLMKKIPVTPDKTVYDIELSHPITFLLTFDNKKKYTKSFPISLLDKLLFIFISFRVWASCSQRKNNVYASVNAFKYLYQYLSKKNARIISQLFGPWVGSDSSRVSLHHTSEFFMRNIFPGAQYYHKQPAPSFTQGSGDGWLILRQPTNESWFDPWVTYLKSKGVQFEFNTSLTQLQLNSKSNTIDYAIVNSGGISKKITADTYVLAINPYITYNILQNSPELLAADKQLQQFKPLVDDYPHTQISFSIYFFEKINFTHNDNPKTETAVILIDSEFDITLFSQDELWKKDIHLGKNIKSLWTGTATLDATSGKLYNLPITKLTKEQFINEIKYQIYRCKGLDELIVNNNGRHLKSFLMEIKVWHTWEFPKNSCKYKCVIDPTQPKWVNNTRNQTYLPKTKTSIPNLYLAGAHTKTNVDLYSMESAVESGRRVADIMTNKNTIIPQHVPAIVKLFRVIDSLLYDIGLPNVIDIFIVILILVFILTQN